MSIKIYNVNTASWEHVSSTVATGIKVVDLEDHFTVDNVNDCLGQLATDMDTLKSRVEYIYENGTIGGGGGGGGGSALPAVTIDGDTTRNVKSDDIIDIFYFFTSPNPGDGIASMSYGDISKIAPVRQGRNRWTVGPFAKGTYNITIMVQDSQGFYSVPVRVTVISGSLELSSPFTDAIDFTLTSDITIPYSVTTLLSQQVFLNYTVDGAKFTAPARIGANSLAIGKLQHMGPTFVTMQVHNDDYTSNILQYTLVAADSTTLYIIPVSWSATATNTIAVGVNLVIDYRVSMKNQFSFNTVLYVDGVKFANVTSKPGVNYWNVGVAGHGALSLGNPHTFRIVSTTVDGSSTALIDFIFNVTQTDYVPFEHERTNLIAEFDATGKLNNSVDRDIWQDRSGNNVHCNLYNFNYTTNGWNNNALDVSGKAYAVIDMAPFDQGIKYGFTAEVAFKTTCVGNVDAKVISCRNPVTPFQGFQIDTSLSLFTSRGDTVQAPIQENTWTKATYVVNRGDTSAGRPHTMIMYINGVISNVVHLQPNDPNVEFYEDQFTYHGKIYIGAEVDVNGDAINNAVASIQSIRIYDRALTDLEIVTNYIADINDQSKQLQARKISGLNDQGQFVPNGLAIPTLDIICDISGMTEDSSRLASKITYNDPTDPSKNFTSDNASYISWQGTSSRIYPVKNWTLQLFYLGNPFLYTPRSEWLPENRWTLKANYMDSSNANNIGMNKYIHDLLHDSSRFYPSEIRNPACRANPDGFPVYLTFSGQLMGIFCWNIDRYASQNYGFVTYAQDAQGTVTTTKDPNIFSYEILANSSTGAGAFILPLPKSDPNSYAANWAEVRGEFRCRYAYDPKPTEFVDINGVSTEVLVQGKHESLLALVEWVNDADDTVFRGDLNRHWSIPHLIDYYLIAYVFGMVDNLGKNMVLTTWGVNNNGDTVWYPSFYDCDSDLGLDNSGHIAFDAGLDTQTGDYNTSNSNLWVKLVRNYPDEISNRYAELRLARNPSPGVTLDPWFSYNTAINYLGTKVLDTIGATLTNQDCRAKYVDIADDSWIFACNGTRREFTERWLNERFIYIDSVYSVGTIAGTKSVIRSNVQALVTINIKSYSPQYVQISFTDAGDAKIRKKCGKNSWTPFTYNLTNATDNNIEILGSANVMYIDGIKLLNPGSINIAQASKLVELDISGSDRINILALGQNTYLQRLLAQDCINLGYQVAQRSIDVSGCINLREIDVSNTHIQSVRFNDVGGVIETLDLSDTDITGFQLTGQDYLSSVLLGGCQDLSTLNITNCRGLQTLLMPDTNLATVVVTGCDSLQTLDVSRTKNLRTFDISGCPGLRNLSMSGVYNLNLTEVNLSYAPLLESLDISASASIRFLIFPAFPALHSNEKVAVTNGVAILDKHNVNLPSITVQLTDTGSTFTDFTPTLDAPTGYAKITLGGTAPVDQQFIYVNYTNNCCLTTLKCQNSTISAVKFGQNATYPTRPDTGYILDLTGIPLKAVDFSACGSLVEVRNISYVATGPSNMALFNNCQNLKTISGNIVLTGNCQQCFAQCANLILPATGLTLNLTAVTGLANAFWNCKALTAANVWTILQAVGPACNDLWQCFWVCSGITGTLFQTYPTLFSKCTGVTRTTDCFSGCSNITGTLPAGLLSYMTNITSVWNMFGGTKISGTIPNDFLRFNTKLTEVGYLFNSTLISALPSPQANLLQYNPLLISVDHMFYACTSLTTQIDPNLFVANPQLQTLTSFFQNCSKVTGPIPRDLFNNIPLTGNTNKVASLNYFFSGTKVSDTIPAADLSGNKGLLDNCQNLVQVEGLFNGCTSLTGTIPPDLLTNNPKISQAGLLFGNDTGLTGTIPPNLFRGKTQLSGAVQVFLGCTALDTTIPQGFLDDCPQLLDVSGMFQSCSKLHGAIPARVSSWASTELFTLLPKIILTVEAPDLTQLIVRLDSQSVPLVRDVNYKVAIIGAQTIISPLGMSPATLLITLPHGLSMSNGVSNLLSDGVDQQSLVVKLFDGTICQKTTDYTQTISGPNIVITRTASSIIAPDQSTIYVTYDRTTPVDLMALLDTHYIDIGTPTNFTVRPLLDTDNDTIMTRNLNPSTGTPTDGSTATMSNLSGVATCVVRVSGTYTGVLTPQTSADGNTWVNIATNALTNLNTNTTSSTIASAAVGVYAFNCPTAQAVRISANAAVTGTAAITLYVNRGTATQTTDYTLAANTQAYVDLTRNRSSTAIPASQAQLLITYAHTDPDIDVRLDLINRSTRPSLIGQFENVTAYGLLDNAVLLTKAANLFSACTQSGFSGTIPPRMFLNNKITDLSNIFNGCWYISGIIPPALLHNCPALLHFDQVFSNCCNLISDPTRLRSDGEMYILPAGFFDKCTNLATVSWLFDMQNPSKPHQTVLTGVLDKDIFRYNTALTNTVNMFAAMPGLHGLIDSDTFKNCINLTNVSYTFYATGIQSLGANLFRTCTLMQDMTYTFYNSTQLTGYAPSYWASDHPLKSVQKTTGCFKGDINLTNWNSPTTDPRRIPDTWR